ncbi:alpha/beta fold hydrolase [Flavobacterium sp. HJ-32-4]|uniref:alpha/beta fold hydrolase n=1 Tax=Flavobacterium sp. HJ-32-4 TaxID=1160795 RepID=UPI001F13D03A|nr:alpha/beta hydrolase [Flavobacterium sp. HJ-32-4]UMY65309.1 alpha/beta hydrolase [Flavobacterium sp. HJ-32-4]
MKTGKPGNPLIVFESGLGMGGGNFEPVFAHLPKDACYVVYDRNGLGESEADDRLENRYGCGWKSCTACCNNYT